MSKHGRTTPVAPWIRRLAAVAAVSLALTTAGAMPAHAADTQSPVILKASASHQSIDVVNGPVEVKVQIEVEDVGSGVATESPWLDPAAGSGIDPVLSQVMTLVSGDEFRGVYEATFTFPEQIRSGDWYFHVGILDRAGNVYSPTGGIGLDLTVTSSDDLYAPEVAASLSKAIIDITDGPGELVLTADAYDEGIGIPLGGTATLNYGKGNLSGGVDISNSSEHRHHAKFTHHMEFSKYDAANDQRGWWAFSFVRGIPDANGNVESNRFIGSVMVATRPLRGIRPNISTNTGTITASWLAHRDVLDILEYEAEFVSTDFSRMVKTTRTTASVTDVPAGTYTVRVRARNKLGWGEWTLPSEPKTYSHSLAPMESTTPTITGTPRVGSVLTADPGTWTPTGPTLSYEWLRNGTAISFATAPTYTLVTADAGAEITARVTAKKAGYQTTSNLSSPTSRIALFTDVTSATVFHAEIAWLAERRVTMGWSEGDGTRTYRPYDPIARGAMAAFLYRLNDTVGFTPPEVSPFVDVPTSDVFYNEITWMAAMGITTGYPEADGRKTFRPQESVNRDMMAAFLYRYAGNPEFEAPATSPFIDVPAGGVFYQHISWLASQGISTGWDAGHGCRAFNPYQPVARDAMAAFVYRLVNGGTGAVDGSRCNPPATLSN